MKSVNFHFVEVSFAKHSIPIWRHALRFFLDQPDAVRANPAVRFELARATDLFASIDIRSGTNEGPGAPPPKPPGREHSPDRSRRSDPVGTEPTDRSSLHERMNERLKSAQPRSFDSNRSNPGDGLALVLLEASDEFRALAQEFPDNAEYQFRLAQCLRHRLVHATSKNEPKIARECFLEAVVILDRLTTKSPNEPRYLFELADTLTQASLAHSQTWRRKNLLSMQSRDRKTACNSFSHGIRISIAAGYGTRTTGNQSINISFNGRSGKEPEAIDRDPRTTGRTISGPGDYSNSTGEIVSAVG